MKQVLIGSLLALTLGMAGCDDAAQAPVDLPWQVTTTSAGNPQVFHLEIGKSTLKDVIERLHSFPETALFVHENGDRTLEAYFGTQRLGLFEAKFIVDLQTDAATLDKLQANAGKREGMASGQWKFPVAETDMHEVNGFLVKKLVYMPAINYEPDIVNARFGAPDERLPSAKAGVEYWFYPQKGLVMTLSNDGGEILYYTTPQNFAALKQEMLEAKPKDE
jgi:hypothetical protein